MKEYEGNATLSDRLRSRAEPNGPAVNWLTPVLLNGYAHADPSNRFQFSLTEDGFLKWQNTLNVDAGVDSAVAFVLPAGYRPASDQVRSLAVETSVGYIDAKFRIAADTGEVIITYLVKAPYEIKVIADGVPLTTGDEQFIFSILDPDLDGMILILAEAYVSTVSSGDITVQYRNRTQAVNMLSTEITIDSGEETSLTGSPAAVINPANAIVALRDSIAVNVTNGGSGASGLGVIFKFGNPA